MLFLDLLQWGDADTHDDGDRQPRQDDEHRKSMDRPRYEWWRGVFVAHVFVAHAAFSTQKVKAFTSCVIFSALTTPSTRMRQPMLSPSPCAAIFATAVAAELANSNDHGKRAPSRCCGSALTSK